MVCLDCAGCLPSVLYKDTGACAGDAFVDPAVDGSSGNLQCNPTQADTLNQLSGVIVAQSTKMPLLLFMALMGTSSSTKFVVAIIECLRSPRGPDRSPCKSAEALSGTPQSHLVVSTREPEDKRSDVPLERFRSFTTSFVLSGCTNLNSPGVSPFLEGADHIGKPERRPSAWNRRLCSLSQRRTSVLVRG